MVASTSKMAYQQLIDTNKLSPARRRVVEILEEYGKPMTRAEISQYSYMFPTPKAYPLQSICGRVNELIEMGALLEDGTTRKCSVTGSTAKVVRLMK